jgi:mRNA-degrading endonuclease RelE of RelBE toxin-antitoxin system
MRWTIRAHRDAMAALYRIPRGDAAIVSGAIRRLEHIPRPADSQAFPDRPNTFAIEPAGHLVVYELLETEQVVHIMFVGDK